MKVRSLNSVNTDLTVRTVNEDANDGVQKATLFSRTLTDLSESAYDRHINELMNKITEQGKRLSERADLAELNAYKGLIRDLINETVSNAFEFSKSNKFGGRSRSKVYAIINKVNEKLESMTKKILNNEADNLDFLANVDDIRGMLVDMLM